MHRITRIAQERNSQFLNFILEIPCGPADLCFLIDGSLSVNATTWGLVKQFLSKAVDYLNIADNDVRVGITEFR